MTETQAVALLESKTAVEIFSEENGLDTLLNKIKAEVKSIDTDVSTQEGRDNVRSLARKVCTSKTTLKKMGDDLGADYKSKYDAIRKEKNRGVSELQTLQDEVRQPLTDFENKEHERTQGHELMIAEIKDTLIFEPHLIITPEEIEKAMAQVETLFSGRDWEEFGKRAKDTYDETLQKLSEKFIATKKAEDDAKELARLKKADEERQQKERDELIAKEATEKAEAEAKEKAEAEAKATAKRESNLKHTKKINNEALASLEKIVTSEDFNSGDPLKKILGAIANGKIKHVSIKY